MFRSLVPKIFTFSKQETDCRETQTQPGIKQMMYNWILNTPESKDDHLSISSPVLQEHWALGAIEPRAGSAPQTSQGSPRQGRASSVSSRGHGHQGAAGSSETTSANADKPARETSL